jgi:hypothetical protein
MKPDTQSVDYAFIIWRGGLCLSGSDYAFMAKLQRPLSGVSNIFCLAMFGYPAMDWYISMIDSTMVLYWGSSDT